ncbi:MAG: nucleotidyltransferase family protein [Methanolinea sp.]
MRRIALRYGVRDMKVFGSVAKRKATETSDIDLLVTLEPGRTLFDLGGLSYELEELLGRHVDVATRPILRKEVRERVEKEAIPL